MLTYVSGQYRTRRSESSPKVREQRAVYEQLARGALFRAYPAMPDLGVELCLLDAGDALELFWDLQNLGGPAPGGWHQVFDLTVEFVRTGDGQTVRHALTEHTAGFHAWYRMRGGMISVLPLSQYLNLDAGEWTVVLAGELQDAHALCLFADSFGDLFHYSQIDQVYRQAATRLREMKHAADTDVAPRVPCRIEAGRFTLAAPRLGKLQARQANRLHQVAVTFADVRDLPVPAITPPPATPLDPVNFLRRQLYYLHEQSVRYEFCPYNTVNHWDHEPAFDRAHFHVNERTAYFHLEALVPLFRTTGDPAVYRTARKWYETIRRNLWPQPGVGTSLTCGDRTVFGAALSYGGMNDALCTFSEIDGDPRWLEPFRAGLLAWPMHPTITRPLMDQDAWGHEELNTNGTYNMCTHFALACWRMGHQLGDAALLAKGERILTGYTFPGERAGIWPYRPGDYPSHHYDMYLKWQLGRLLATGAPRWTQDAAFLALMRRATDATLRHYARPDGNALLFTGWTHSPQAEHPANAARHGGAVLDTLIAATLYVDAGYLEPLTQTLRGLYRLLPLPAVDRCWHGSWFHIHANLLSLALHGFHVEGTSAAELRVVR